MIANVLLGFGLGVLLPLALGFPLASMLGLGRGIRSLGFATALGVSAWLIVCRAVQLIWPIATAVWPMTIGLVLIVSSGWTKPSVRMNVRLAWTEHRATLGALAIFATAVATLLCAPILFGDAIEYDGSRNIDSFTFVSSAKYMLTHTFAGAPDFSPLKPVWTISRGYFGAGAMQPRPAAEGFLAWVSAVLGRDPVYLFNAVQAAAVILAALSTLAFIPESWRAGSIFEGLMVATFAMLCPTLIHVAVNSNYASAMCLPAATGYLAIGCVRRTPWVTVAGVVFVGALLSGYPELLVFAGLMRTLAVVGQGLVIRSAREILLEGLWMLAEVAVACSLMWWAAWGAWVTYRTTLQFSHAGATDLGGNMWAGIPMAVAAAIALGAAWSTMGRAEPLRRARAACLGFVLAFAFAQGLMVYRGFDYGGMRLATYFVTAMIGVLLLTMPAWLAAGRLTPVAAGRVPQAVALALMALMIGQTLHEGSTAWRWSLSRRVTSDLVAVGQQLPSFTSAQKPVIAMGASPAPPFYGEWVAYFAAVPIAYDFATNADAAGYLSPYLRAAGADAPKVSEAAATLIVTRHIGEHVPGQILSVGRVHLVTAGM